MLVLQPQSSKYSWFATPRTSCDWLVSTRLIHVCVCAFLWHTTCEVFVQIQEGQTPLLIAVRKGNIVLAQKLLDAGANPNYIEVVSIDLWPQRYYSNMQLYCFCWSTAFDLCWYAMYPSCIVSVMYSSAEYLICCCHTGWTICPDVVLWKWQLWDGGTTSQVKSWSRSAAVSKSHTNRHFTCIDLSVPFPATGYRIHCSHVCL